MRAAIPRLSLLLLAIGLADPGGGAAPRRGLAGVARHRPHRRLDRNRPANVLVARGREPRLEGALRRPIRTGRVRRSPLPADTPSGFAGANMQERLICFHADTGKLLWEHKYNIFTSDVPPHRIAWASPAVDPATGNVFAFSGNGLPDVALEGRQAALGAVARRRVRHVDDARRAHVVADHRRQSGHRQRPHVQLGRSTPAARTASSRSTRRRDTPTGSAPRKGGRPTRSTRTRSSPTSTACGCSSRAAATARCTR